MTRVLNPQEIEEELRLLGSNRLVLGLVQLLHTEIQRSVGIEASFGAYAQNEGRRNLAKELLQRLQPRLDATDDHDSDGTDLGVTLAARRTDPVRANFRAARRVPDNPFDAAGLPADHPARKA